MSVETSMSDFTTNLIVFKRRTLSSLVGKKFITEGLRPNKDTTSSPAGQAVSLHRCFSQLKLQMKKTTQVALSLFLHWSCWVGLGGTSYSGHTRPGGTISLWRTLWWRDGWMSCIDGVLLLRPGGGAVSRLLLLLFLLCCRWVSVSGWGSSCSSSTGLWAGVSGASDRWEMPPGLMSGVSGSPSCGTPSQHGLTFHPSLPLRWVRPLPGGV